jgi:hypothetical protein
VFNYADIAASLGFKSADDAKKYLSENPNIWVSADYTKLEGQQPFAVLAKVPPQQTSND